MTLGRLGRISLFSAALAILSYGQQSTGTLIATIMDPGGSFIPQAHVTVTLIEQNAVREANSGQAGDVRFDALIAGVYRVQVNRSGFKTLTIDQVVLQSSESRDLGRIVLQVGAVNESVEVTAEATPVQTASSERADSVTSAQLENIPTKGRDPYGELHLLPGVMEIASSRDLSVYSEMGTFSVNGLSGQQLSPNVDGASIQQMAGTSLVFVTPNMDAIDEVRVLANGYQAEYGRDAGAAINFITKSGTSQFHGTFHWDHRNEGLNANTFFNNRQNTPRQIYRYLTLGGSLGGPLYIPKVMPALLKNKFFFFYSPEYATSKQPTNTAIANEPTALERGGDFSKSFYATTAAPTTPLLLVIKDPNTGVAFPGNVIPPSRINPIGQGMLNLLQKPNGYVNPAQPYAANATFSDTPTFKKLDNVLRTDANITKNVTAYFRMVRDIQDQGFVNSVTPGLGSYLQNTPGGTYLGHVAWVIKPNIVNEAQVVYGWTTQGVVAHTTPDDTALYHSSALDPPRLAAYPTGKKVPWGYNEYPPFLPVMNFTGGNYSGYPTWNPNGSGSQYLNGDHQYLIRDDLSWVHGKHTFKGGVYWERSDDFDEGGPGSNFTGTYNFGSASTNPNDTGAGYANALLGVTTQYTEASARPYQQRFYKAWEYYIQDNWKVTPRLTLDIGIRFLSNGTTYDQSKYSAHFVPSAFTATNAPVLFQPACAVAGATCSAANQQAVNPLNGKIFPSSAIAQVVPGTNAVDGVEYPVVHGLTYPAVVPQPRFGAAWNVFGDNKTVIRGSVAFSSQRPSLNNNMIGSYSAPVVYANAVSNTSISAISTSGANAFVSPITGAVASQIKLETVRSWNLTLERSVGFSTVVNVAYVGTFDRHSPLPNGALMTLNNIPFGSYALSKNIFSGAEVNSNLLRTQFPGIGVVNLYCGCLSTLNYNALQTSVKHRFTRGLTFNGNYQFSKALGTSGWDPYHTGQPITAAYGGTITLPSQRQFYYGPTTTDRTHYAGANFAYQIPTPGSFGKLTNYVLGGWTLSGVTSFSTGAAVSPGCTTNAAYPANDPTWTGLITGTSGVRCQVSGDWKNFTQDFYHNFNIAAFSYPTGGTAASPAPNFGNTGLGIMRQPSFWNQDLTINKAFSLGEKGRSLQMSFQAFNVFNHTEFNTIGTAYTFTAAGVNTNTTTGQYTAAQPNRQIVMSAKFQF